MTELPDPIVFVCSHGCRYTAFELECGMRLVDMDAEMARQESEHNFEQDSDCESVLAHRTAQGDEDCPWPWYADDYCEIVEPEIVEP